MIIRFIVLFADDCEETNSLDVNSKWKWSRVEGEEDRGRRRDNPALEYIEDENMTAFRCSRGFVCSEVAMEILKLKRRNLYCTLSKENLFHA